MVNQTVLLNLLATQVYLGIYRWYLRFNCPPPSVSALLEDIDLKQEIESIYEKVMKSKIVQ